MNARSKYTLIWEQMEGPRIRYGAAALSLVVASCFLYLVPMVPQVVLDGVLAKDPSHASGYVREVVRLVGGAERFRANLWIALVLVLVLTGFGALFTYLRGRWSGLAAEQIARRLRDRLHDHLHHLPCRFYDSADTGDLVQRCTSDVETFRVFLSTQLVEIGRAVVMMVLPLPLMIAIDPRMTLVSVAFIPIIVASSVMFFRRVQGSFQAVDEAEAAMTSTLQENLSGIRVVRAFARQDFEAEKFGARNHVHRGKDLRLYRLMGGFWSLSDLLCGLQIALVVGIGSYWMSRGELPVGTFYFFLAAVNLFMWPVRMMGRILTELGKALVAIGRIYEILAEKREQDAVAGRGDVPVADTASVVVPAVGVAPSRTSAAVPGVGVAPVHGFGGHAWRRCRLVCGFDGRA
ncbi:MAG: ABC transporter ATP-binding protein [Candidatus Eisenbacteria bacterium]